MAETLKNQPYEDEISRSALHDATNDVQLRRIEGRAN